MITILNRKELLITYDQKLWRRTMDILDANHIEYINRMRSIGHGFMSNRDSRIGIDPDFYWEYKVYVKRKDFSYAEHLIHKD